MILDSKGTQGSLSRRTIRIIESVESNVERYHMFIYEEKRSKNIVAWILQKEKLQVIPKQLGLLRE